MPSSKPRPTQTSVTFTTIHFWPALVLDADGAHHPGRSVIEFRSNLLRGGKGSQTLQTSPPKPRNYVGYPPSTYKTAQYFGDVSCRYDEHPHCEYEEGRLHFAVHIRMGDRRGIVGEAPEYVEKVERIMSIMSEGVTGKGLNPPLFHVFSETGSPCPSESTGLFAEFPSWPVELHQVRNSRARVSYMSRVC